MHHFKGQLQTAKSSNKQGSVLRNSNLQSEVVLEHAQNCATSPEHKVTEVALYLRSVITQEKNKCKDLPYPLTPAAVSTG